MTTAFLPAGPCQIAYGNRPAIRSQVAIALKQMALPAGFDIDVEVMPHDTYLANVWMKGNFYMGYWGMQATEDEAFNLLLTSNAAYEDTAWKNAPLSRYFWRWIATSPSTIFRLRSRTAGISTFQSPGVIPKSALLRK